MKFEISFKKNSITCYKGLRGTYDINEILKIIPSNSFIVKASKHIKIISEEELIKNPPSQFSFLDITFKPDLLRFIELSKGQIRFMHTLHSMEVIDMLEKNIEIRNEI